MGFRFNNTKFHFLLPIRRPGSKSNYENTRSLIYTHFGSLAHSASINRREIPGSSRFATTSYFLCDVMSPTGQLEVPNYSVKAYHYTIDFLHIHYCDLWVLPAVIGESHFRFPQVISVPSTVLVHAWEHVAPCIVIAVWERYEYAYENKSMA